MDFAFELNRFVTILIKMCSKIWKVFECATSKKIAKHWAKLEMATHDLQATCKYCPNLHQYQRLSGCTWMLMVTK